MGPPLQIWVDEFATHFMALANVQIESFPIKRCTFTFVDDLDPHYTLIFNSAGQLIQAIPKQPEFGSLWIRWTLSNSEHLRFLRQRNITAMAILRRSSGVRFGEDEAPWTNLSTLEAIFRREGDSPATSLKITPVSLLNPESKTLCRAASLE